MIELIHQLLKNTGAEKMTITITPNGENVQVIAHTAMGALPNNANYDVMNARNALQVPVVVSGFIGEVDAEFGNMILQYSASFEGAARTVESNLDSVKGSHEKAKTTQLGGKSGVSEKKQATSVPAPATSTTDSSAVTVTETETRPTEDSPVQEAVKDDDLFADSL